MPATRLMTTRPRGGILPGGDPPPRPAGRRRRYALMLAVALLLMGAAPAGPAWADVTSGSTTSATMSGSGSALENAAANASDTGRKVALSLIALAFSSAAIVLAFRRDFKEAAGVLVIGAIAVLLATPAGISLIQDTVTSVFGNG